MKLPGRQRSLRHLQPCG